MRARTKIITSLCALAAVGGGVVTGANAGSDESQVSGAAAQVAQPALAQLSPAAAAAAKTSAVPAVQARIASRFALFRNQPAQAVPEPLATQIASPSRFGRNPALARTIQTPNGTGWVIPGDGYICLAVPDRVDGYGEGCTTTEVAIQQGLWVRLRGQDAESKALDTLVLPDGADAVVDTAGGTVALGDTQDGVISQAVTAAEPPRLVPGD